MPGHKHLPPLILLLAVLSAQVGCVALNVPSQRYHDPDDKGGVFGHWKPHPQGTSCQTEVNLASGDPCTTCLDGGPLEREEDAFGPEGAQPPEPEVPWPRFHPVPTRPLLSGTVGH